MSLEWERLFLKILDRHAPIRQRKVRNNYAPHINSDLRRKMFLRDYYKKKHRFTKSENDWQQYKKLRNAVNIENAKTKTDYFTQELGEANSDIKETWKILNSALGKRSKTTTIHKLEVNDNDVSDPKQISDELNSYFCNIAESILKDSDNTSVSNTPFEPYILKIAKSDSLFKFKRVTSNDIVYHVAKLKTSRSGKVPTRFLKDGVKCIAHVLSSLLNKSMESGVFPDNLKIAAICPIYKGEGSKSRPNNNKRISALPIVARLFEKIIHNQLYDYVKGRLYKYQSGFRPKHSTETAVLNALNRWFLNIDQGKYNLVVFLDLRKAFDTVNHEILLKKLEHYGVHGTELKWFTSYLNDRKQYTVVGAIKSQLGSVSHGVPQGSCLGPFLFFVYINDLPYCINNGISELYADDTGLSASGKKVHDVERLINLDLDKVYNWLHANKLSINMEKTKCMIFATEYKLRQCPDLAVKINGSKIKQVDRKDYLGLTLDIKLKWDKQVHEMCKKISSAISGIKLARFLPVDALKKLYNSLVESRLRYCCTV